MDSFAYTRYFDLKAYCESENFKGWDPYDGLNSKLFQVLPLKHWDVARLAWIQGFKRSPINFRRLLLVPKEFNAKGIALFLSGYCNLYQLAKKGNTIFGPEEDLKAHIVALADKLLEMKNTNYSGACWGYNFDWQARRLFLFPKNTPTVVATAFCVDGLLKAYEVTKNEKYLKTAISAADFVTNDLNRTPYKSGFLFSYSSLNGNNTVFNASLLGAKILIQVYRHTKKEVLKTTATSTIKACCEAQDQDGAWVYGMLPVQQWIDSFHTGYNLEAIQCYQDITGDQQFKGYIEKGLHYYLSNFFLSDGTPKYYHDKTYPIDIHCPGQLFVTLAKTDQFKENKELAEKVLKWTLENMQDRKGFFYYQLKKGLNSKISYMRWSNAFMFNALSNYFVETFKQYPTIENNVN
jgi:hypothetical protein